MRKSNDTSKRRDAKIENRVLADSELDAVTGGFNLLGGFLPRPSVPPPPSNGHLKFPGDIQLK
jgi:hypothetical protein